MKIAIIGAGVIGLSTGVALLDTFQHMEVIIFAEKLTPDTTSDVAAGLWFPYSAGDGQPDIERWCATSHRILTNIVKNDPKHHIYGIMLQDIYRLTDNDHVKITFVDKLLRNSRLMNQSEISMFGSHKNGIAATTFMTQGTKLMSHFMERFIAKGGRIINERVENIDTLQSREKCPIIVNCSGLGARELCNDLEIYPIRGQIIRVEAPWVKYAICHEGSYILPQSDGTVVLGGTAQKNNYNLNPDEIDTENIKSGCFKLLPGLKECKILEIKVGLRPYRATVRLETEKKTNKENGDKYTIIHNYGHGGSGLTLSWGCAENVVELVKAAIAQDQI